MDATRPERSDTIASLQQQVAELQAQLAALSTNKTASSVEVRPCDVLKPWPPEKYKPQWRFESWWTHLQIYLQLVARGAPDDLRAELILNSLSQAAYDGLMQTGIEANELTDPVVIERKLQARFGDRRTPRSYAAELDTLVQRTKEDVAEFLDRVRSIAMRAFPEIDRNGTLFKKKVMRQFVSGINSKELCHDIFNELGNSTVKDLNLDNFRAIARTKEANLLDACALSTNSAANGRQKAAKVAIKCQYCNKKGHTAKVCYQIPGNKPGSSASIGEK